MAPVVLVLPARDEAASVGAVVRRAPAAVAGHPVVCVVVDDSSTDGTAARAAEAGATVVHGPGRGLGAAVRRGLRAATALDPVAIAFCDADGEYAPEELGRLVRPILDDEADYVVGSRFAGEIHRMHPHRRLGNRVLTAALRAVARAPITDGQSGYRALHPDAARNARIAHDYNYAQVLTLELLGQGWRYAEVPITYAFRTEGRSFVRLAPYLAHVVPAVVRQLAHNRRLRRDPRSVLDDVRRELPARSLPGGGIERPVVAERAGGGPCHRERMVGVVVCEQTLPTEVHHAGEA
jgi:glycosyltransferase involved in cell wall biosynthesis